jgi:hypothetical protein
LLLALQAHSPLKPVLVFVSSRRQTRLTALDLIAFAAADERAEQFVHMPEDELQDVVANIRVRVVRLVVSWLQDKSSRNFPVTMGHACAHTRSMDPGQLATARKSCQFAACRLHIPLCAVPSGLCSRLR